jgi:hypothetical protein
MPYYRPAGQDFYFFHPVPELEPFELTGTEQAAFVPRLFLKNKYIPGSSVPPPLTLSCKTVGWVGGEQREVESWSAPPGTILKVAGGSDFYIAPGGQAIVRADETKEMTDLDREILVGPALVLALALRGTWCLHASAARMGEATVAFLGESGQGKSTLAASLADTNSPDWCLVADDILPVTMDSTGVYVWPHFPQLKLPLDAQPGPGLPERLPLNRICVLTQADKDDSPDLQLLPRAKAVQTLLSHTAGARLFDPALLAGHLAFCGEVVGQVPVYRLMYPHRRDALRTVKHLLESLG